MINIKADIEVKKSAQKIAHELGLPLSGVINAFLKDFIRSRSISFSSVPHMTPALESVLGKIESDVKTGKNMSRVFSSSKQASDYLDTLCK